MATELCFVPPEMYFTKSRCSLFYVIWWHFLLILLVFCTFYEPIRHFTVTVDYNVRDPDVCDSLISW